MHIIYYVTLCVLFSEELGSAFVLFCNEIELFTVSLEQCMNP